MEAAGEYIATSKAKRGSATYSVTVPEDGVYTVQFKVFSDTKSRSQIKFSVNDSKHETLRFYDKHEREESVWKTGSKAEYEVELEAGTHT
ncbi:hypothetical protein CL655_01435 [bacterium]|nr:hypothetical protein [bacterium]|tara:strand:- start:1592 stop:1861 length:270 start_codon:yes stop_codon:yes gene_type:complete